MLTAEPDPSLLSEDILVIMLTEVFPHMPVRLQRLIQRFRRLSRTVCYLDIDFDEQHLEVRVQDLLDLTHEIVWIVVESCTRVIEGHIGDMAKKLHGSKRRLEQAKKEYKEYVNLVAKTREDLDEAQRELQHAQRKDREVKKNIKYLWLRSHSREAHEGSAKRSGSGVSIEAPSKAELGRAARSSKYVTGFHGDSESTSLADDKDMGGYEADVHDSGVEGSSVSLLTSVMKEVAVIERRHSQAGDVDDKLQKVLRSTRQSVLLTKKQMCQRLDSNVSAEQECITKEDLLNMRRAETAKLKSALKKLKKDCNSMKRGSAALTARMAATAEAIRKGSSGDEEVANAMAEVHLHRSEENNKLLTEVRREAVLFASRVKMFSVQDWLAARQFTKQEVNTVYSSVKIKGHKDTHDVLDLLKEDVDAPAVIVISGPKGSGKTSLCHYILHQWRTNSAGVGARLRECDLVIYAAMSDIASSGSWNQYLREHVLCHTVKDYPNSSIHEEMKNMTVLFLLDVEGTARDAVSVLKEIMENLGRNCLLLTTRSGNEGEFVQVVKDVGVKCVLAEMCPMTPQAIREYASHFFSLCESHKNSETSERVEQFSNLMSSMSINPTVLYPLPLAYLLYLWCVNPNHVLFSTSVSSLFSRLLSVCQHRLAEAIKGDCGGSREAARLAVGGHLEQLYRATKELVAGGSWQHGHQVLLEADHCLFKDPRVLWHFSPLIVVRSGAGGGMQGLLAHPSLAEILYGFFLAESLLVKSRRNSVIRRPKLSALCKHEPRMLRDVLLHVAGSFLYSKHTLDDAKDVVSTYEKSLRDKENMGAWLTFLQECNFTSNLCEAVSLTLASQATWIAARHAPETNRVVAELLRRGAYKPKLVVVTPDASDGERGEGVRRIIHALGTCPTTFVHLRQEAQFYTWGDETTSDALVVPLQPPGTLQECWGHLGTEGAMALRHCHHLEELNVRVSSMEALAALTHSIASQRRYLKYLYLRLDLPTSIPSASFQPLNFKGKKLWLRLRNITDSSATWVRDLTKKLSSWYTEVVLEESQLSPSVLHDLKESMPRTPLHVSG